MKIIIKEHLDIALKLLVERHPNFKKYIDIHFFDKKRNGDYFGHVFVMKRILFNTYCEIFFPFLFELLEKMTVLLLYKEEPEQ